eukprot:gnl/MRDRNA2_/MRDRNA2_320722_c0_seq1.p1 gnl/MRDRNA2_/MRDRNA2_320722_c0~~gnl/MRDRNA2_/MRDRNA2_320722_c0_seq1.p1  ORF type:complete len:144 (+),score=17.78 gnl/MRDRNA2_/MRDRNA2_320722_c0_seq1:37-468(+)
MTSQSSRQSGSSRSLGLGGATSSSGVSGSASQVASSRGALSQGRRTSALKVPFNIGIRPSTPVASPLELGTRIADDGLSARDNRRGTLLRPSTPAGDDLLAGRTVEDENMKEPICHERTGPMEISGLIVMPDLQQQGRSLESG